METLGSGSGSVIRRSSSRLKRKPFSDLTNYCSSSSSSLKSKSTPVPEPEPSDPKPAPPSTSGREDDGELEPPDPEPGPSSSGRGDDNDQENPPSTPKPNPNPNRDFTGSSNHAENNHEIEISTVYTRRMKERRKNKEIAVEAVPSLSCPPVGKRRSTEENVGLKANDVDRHKSFSVPHGNKKKKSYKVPEPIQRPMLPEDFVTSQRAYFAEVDAYELPEEEISNSDIE